MGLVKKLANKFIEDFNVEKKADGTRDRERQ
jgi:hypothetical protein